MTAAIQLPDVVSDDLYMTAVEVIEAHTSLENAKASEPDWAGEWPVNGHETWTRWNDQEYGPAVDRWQATIDQLRAHVPVEPSHALLVARAVVDARRARHKTLTATLCECCRRRESSTVVVVDGEPFRVCAGCVLPEAGAVAS